MLNWFKSSAAEEGPAKGPLDLEAIKQEECAILFKHSRTCPVSFMAQAQVKRFVALHPEVPVHTLVVQDDRELSREVAQWTGIRHESPQVFVLRKGTVVASTSHEGVTAEYLAEAVQP
ncbi:MAG: bacillithiol system redox-active protein YtxJ [Acidobacteria bacterium]|nr:bacillithiol system redox-active protein YtxJ [Acidobacteriota bacterium]